MRTAKVKRAESLLTVSLAIALICRCTSLRTEWLSDASDDSPSLRSTTDALSTSLASGCLSRNPLAASTTSETSLEPPSCADTVSINDARSSNTSLACPPLHTDLPAMWSADTRLRTVPSPGVAKKLRLSLSYMLPLSLMHTASRPSEDACPSSSMPLQHPDTSLQMAMIPPWHVLEWRFLLIRTFRRTMNTDPTTSASTLTGRSSADTGTDSMNAYPSRNGKCIGDLRSCVVM